MKERNLLIAAILVTLIAIVLVAVKVYVPLPWFGDTIPGSESPITVETSVKIYMYLTDPNPNIGEIKSRIISPAEFRTENVEILIFPWKGTLKLEVVSPSGSKLTLYKDVMIDRGLYTERTYYFTWTTKQRGKHTIYVTLYDDDGNAVDSKSGVITI